jgi:hypothetical protein
MNHSQPEFSVEAENGTTVYTSEDVARAVAASDQHGYTLGVERSPLIAAFTRPGPDAEWEPLTA